MKFLFIFAHPDDETIGCGGTIAQLVDQGHDVHLVSVTDGGAGEVMKPAQELFRKLGSVKALRAVEMAAVSEYFGARHSFLGYQDGQLTNEQVWGQLKEDIITLIETERPDIVVTFDHTGWYFHLDHVGVSIATTWAVKQAIFTVPVVLLSQMRVTGTKWEYIYPPLAPTHFVRVKNKAHKIAAIETHLSQDLETVKKFVTEQPEHREWYELAIAIDQGKQLLQKLPLFEVVSDPEFRL